MRGNLLTCTLIVMLTLTAVSAAPILPPPEAQTERFMDGQGLLIIIDPEVPNVAQGDWIYWPITLHNTEDEPIRAVLGVEGVRDWATYRIDPMPVITVQPGEQEMAYLYMSVDEDAWLGLREFTITARHDGVTESRPAQLAVLKPAERDNGLGWLAWTLIGIAVLLVLLGILILASSNNRERQGGDDDDLITYY